MDSSTYKGGNFMKFLLLISIALSLFANDFENMKKSFEKGEINKAISYAKYNAANGNTNAMYNLGLLYYAKGDKNRAKRWFENSYANDGRGRVATALIIFDNSSSKYDYKRVVEILQNAKQSDIRDTLLAVANDLWQNKLEASPQQYLKLAQLYSNDKIIRPNNKLAFFLIQKSAQLDDTKALELLADAYNTTQYSPIVAPTRQNTLIKAIHYYEKSYKIGNNYDAMAKLARLYLVGPRHVRRIQLGEQLMHKAASNGSQIAQEMLKSKNLRSYTPQNEDFLKSYHILFRKF